MLHMHICGDKHTHTHTVTQTCYDQKVCLAHSMHECCKLSHTSCTTVLSQCTKALSDCSQCLSTSEALFTLTTPTPERGSSKQKYVSWILTLLPHLNKQPQCMTHNYSGGVKIGWSTCKFITRNSGHFSTTWNQAAPCDYHTNSETV